MKKEATLHREFLLYFANVPLGEKVGHTLQRISALFRHAPLSKKDLYKGHSASLVNNLARKLPDQVAV